MHPLGQEVIICIISKAVLVVTKKEQDFIRIYKAARQVREKIYMHSLLTLIQREDEKES